MPGKGFQTQGASGSPATLKADQASNVVVLPEVELLHSGSIVPASGVGT
jgi:hypothetical protein